MCIFLLFKYFVFCFFKNIVYIVIYKGNFDVINLFVCVYMFFLNIKKLFKNVLLVVYNLIF